MAPFDGAQQALDRHWAVATIEREDRDATLAFAEGALARLLEGKPHATDQLPPHLTPLAGAYEFAAREWLDPDGSGHPYENLPSEQFAERWMHLETGASRAFLLYAVVPSPDDDEVGAMLHTLLLCALAQVGNRQADFRRWLAARHRDNGHEDPNAPWDAILLRRVVRLWTEVLRRTDPVGLEQAMEIVASIREERTTREAQLLESLDGREQVRMRFYLFALYHLTEAATELLMFRLRGTPEAASVIGKIHARLVLAREATSGDYRLHPAMDWLHEAATRVAEQRTMQLDLLDNG